MKIFKFLKGHGINFLIALVLLFAQANCELTLPGLMSDIVDVGISQGGIESPVPNEITAGDLSDVELFLNADETAKVEAAFSAPNQNDVRSFTGDDETRAELAGFIGEAEMLAYQFNQGVPVSDLAESGAMGSGTAASNTAAAQMPGVSDGKVTMDTIRTLVDAGAISKDGLVDARAKLVSKLGDNGETIVSSRAIAFVEDAYRAAGVDLNQVRSDYLWSQGATMLSFALFSAFCAIAAAFNASKTAAAIARDLRHSLYERVLSFSPAEMNRFSAASLITRGTNDIQQIQMVLVMCLRIVLFAPCMGLGAVFRVLTTPTGLEWILVAAIVVIAVAIGVLMGLTMPKFRIMQKLVDRNNLVAREIITGIMPIRAFGRQAYERERYDRANRELTATYIFTNRCMALLMPVMLIVMNATSVGIIWFGGHGVDAGTIMVGDLMAYINYVM